jgi:hypothetical protein
MLRASLCVQLDTAMQRRQATGSTHPKALYTVAICMLCRPLQSAHMPACVMGATFTLLHKHTRTHTHTHTHTHTQPVQLHRQTCCTPSRWLCPDMPGAACISLLHKLEAVCCQPHPSTLPSTQNRSWSSAASAAHEEGGSCQRQRASGGQIKPRHSQTGVSNALAAQACRRRVYPHIPQSS